MQTADRLVSQQGRLTEQIVNQKALPLVPGTPRRWRAEVVFTSADSHRLEFASVGPTSFVIPGSRSGRNDRRRLPLAGMSPGRNLDPSSERCAMRQPHMDRWRHSPRPEGTVRSSLTALASSRRDSPIEAQGEARRVTRVLSLPWVTKPRETHQVPKGRLG